MPVESDADLASLFNLDEFAVAGNVTPASGGGPYPCAVVWDRGDGEVRLLGSGVIAELNRAYVHVADLDVAIATGDTVAIEGTSYKVRKSEADATRGVYTVEMRPS